MELVYLWVEDYKNIKRQGFNFSPRFECKFYDEYDENNKLKDDCKLVICDKKKNESLDNDSKKCKPCKDNSYIENFFGDNINVTAIVGKNGSGKSSISEMIRFGIPHKRHSKYIIQGYDKKTNKHYSYGIKGDYISLATSGVEICASNNRNTNHNIVYINGTTLDFRTNEKYEYSDEDNNIFIPKYIHQYKNNLEFFKNKTFFYQFNKVRFILKELNINDIIQDINSFYNDKFDKKQLEKSLLKLSPKNHFCDILKMSLIRFYILTNKTYDLVNIERILLLKNCYRITQEDFNFISDDSFIKEAIKDVLEYLNNNKLHTESDLQNNKRYYFEFDIEDKNLDKLWIFENFFDIPNFVGTKKENLPIFNLELYDSQKDMTYDLLSNGEKQYIRLLIEIITNRGAGDLSQSINPEFLFF